MTDRVQIIIRSDADRRRVSAFAQKTGFGTIVEFRKATRSHEQNALLWSRLQHIADTREWYGQKLTAEDWKDLFTAALRKSRVVPGMELGSVVALGMRTSKMTVQEMNDLLVSMEAWAAENGIVFPDQDTSAEPPLR